MFLPLDTFSSLAKTGKVPFDWKSAQITVFHKKESNVKYQTIDLCHSRVLQV